MAKSNKPKREKKITTEFSGINIKVLSDTRSGPEMYEKIFWQIFRKGDQINVGYGKGICILRIDERTADVNGIDYKLFTGKIAKFSLIETNDWLDFNKKIKTTHSLPDNLFPNLIEEEYLFVPSIHRLYVRSASKITINNLIDFFSIALEGLVGEKEQYSVSPMSSKDSIDRILGSKTLLKLDVKISYTNSDLGEDAMKVLDDLFKDGDAAKAEVTIIPKNKAEGLNADSTLVKGLVELAKENGSAVATIKESVRGKSVKVDTKMYPERIPIETTESGQPLWELFKKEVSERKNDE